MEEKEMITMEMLNNCDFGTVHIQRLLDADYTIVHVMKSTACLVDLLDATGTNVLDPSMKVLTTEDIPNAVGELWLELQRRLHYGRTGRRNNFGLFFHDPLPFRLTVKEST